MDTIMCMVLSAIETSALLALKRSPSSLIRFFFLLFLAQYLAVKLYNIFIYPYYRSPLRHLPGPKDDVPFIGQTLRIYRSDPGVIQTEWSRQFPEAPLIRYIGFAGSENILLNNAHMHREVLQTHCYDFVKPAWLARVVGEIAGTGLLFAEGDFHKKQRKLLVDLRIGPFQFSNVKELLPIFATKSAELVHVLSTKVQSDTWTKIEVSSLISKTTLDIIGLSVLGYELNQLSSSSTFAACYESLLSPPPIGQIIALVQQFIPVRQFIPLNANKDFLYAKKKVRQLLVEHIRTRKQELLLEEKVRVQSKAGRSLLTLMIEERAGGADLWTEDEMLGHLLNFMAAGHETTAGSLTWALHALTLWPEVQVRLRNEIHTALSDSRDLTYSAIEGLKFLNNFTKEVLRYYSPAISTPREAARDVMINGTLFPKGTNVIIVPSLPQHNKRIWGLTADDFDPDRHDNLPKEALDPYAFQSFISGPRICIGKSFALLEFKTIMIFLLRKFEFEATGESVMAQRGTTPSLRPIGGLKLRVKII